MMSTELNGLNQLNAADTKQKLFACCGSKLWASEMSARRPFPDEEALLTTADVIWWGLEQSDWLEAFGQHPRIGDLESLQKKYPGSDNPAAKEQAGVDSASREVLDELAEANQTYEDRFGYIFIVCATNKTAGEMLERLKSRLGNDPARELKIAAEEQRQITRLRLQKLLEAR